LNGILTEKSITSQLYKIRDLGYDIQFAGTVYSLDVMKTREAELFHFMKEPASTNTHHYLLSPMAGTLVSVAVKVGDKVHIGQELAIVEAMKMQNILRASHDATVKAIPTSPGKPIPLDDVIIEFDK